jgi:Tol biopolymer transport system component
MSLASDDRHAAVASVDAKNGNRDIWVLDTTTSRQSRTSFDAGLDDSPTWYPDRQHILFVGQRRGFWAIFQKAIGAATNEEAISLTKAASAAAFASAIFRQTARSSFSNGRRQTNPARQTSGSYGRERRLQHHTCRQTLSRARRHFRPTENGLLIKATILVSRHK